jgi:hypothetical protein
MSTSEIEAFNESRKKATAAAEGAAPAAETEAAEPRK